MCRGVSGLEGSDKAVEGASFSEGCAAFGQEPLEIGAIHVSIGSLSQRSPPVSIRYRGTTSRYARNYRSPGLPGSWLLPGLH